MAVTFLQEGKLRTLTYVIRYISIFLSILDQNWTIYVCELVKPLYDQAAHIRLHGDNNLA